MKRKNMISLMFVFILIIVLCSACNGTITRELRHDGFTIGGDFICDDFYSKNKEDALNKVKFYTSNSNIITDTGKIYEVSLSQKYSNKENCKEAATSIRVKAIMDDNVVKATDNKYYSLTEQSGVSRYSEITESNNSYALYDMLLKDNDVVKVMTVNGNSNTYYVLKTDGNVYAIVINSDNNTLKLSSTQIVYDKVAYGSNIIDFNYSGEKVPTYIRTKDKVYRMMVTNGDECKKYADVTCSYKMDEDTVINKYLDRIILFNGSTLITDYKKVFTAS